MEAGTEREKQQKDGKSKTESQEDPGVTTDEAYQCTEESKTQDNKKPPFLTEENCKPAPAEIINTGRASPSPLQRADKNSKNPKQTGKRGNV